MPVSKIQILISEGKLIAAVISSMQNMF